MSQPGGTEESPKRQPGLLGGVPGWFVAPEWLLGGSAASAVCSWMAPGWLLGGSWKILGCALGWLLGALQAARRITRILNSRHLKVERNVP